MVADDIREIMRKLNDHEKRLAALENRGGPVTKTKKALSIKEFFLSKKPKSHVDKVLVIAYYFETYRAIPSYDKKDIKKGFTEAKVKPPGNLSEAIRANVSKGLLMETGEKEAGLTKWALTNTGERFVEKGFIKEA